MEAAAAKLIGAGLAVIALAGVGIGIGSIFSSMIATVGRNPATQGQLQGIMWIGFALTEAVALFALLIALIILFS